MHVSRDESMGIGGEHVIITPFQPLLPFLYQDVPVRSRGTARLIGPCSVCTGFGLLPFQAGSDFEGERA